MSLVAPRTLEILETPETQAMNRRTLATIHQMRCLTTTSTAATSCNELQELAQATRMCTQSRGVEVLLIMLVQAPFLPRAASATTSRGT